ncbi:Fpg/Nei family DNA glycosylase [Knoellia subterranea]|uniref:DNA-(apurinic or apyrimidinic site) lyase n=1 Tax=Knoellia subterranea KCTC 19937 TaxID=1385521 RepID=A0A0A0JSR2_9MICO|nr:DNA-formamidopyrimidine glycosylase family protein [Knoellia subterranea]KGN39102.1 DNA glycosylase [Knoellia subterranea KCTC 19937]
MPEGDTVWRTADRLHRALRGGTVTVSDLRFPEVATVDVQGSVTTEVVSVGKHLLHRLDCGRTIHSHLRMEGQWRLERPADAARWLRRADLRAAVGTTDWIALGLRLGQLDVLPTAREHEVVGHLGPDVLGPTWDAAEATRRLSASDAPIGAALLDQTLLAGVGTLWAAESLFLERLGPWTPADQLDPKAVADLVTRIHRLMDHARKVGVQSSTGSRRRGDEVHVHARSGLPCRRCGGPVRVSAIGPAGRERSMFYCPTCQGGRAPHDDGHAQRPLGASRSGRRVRTGP